MSQPRLSQVNLWKNHEKRVIEVLLLALSLLQTNSALLLSACNEEALCTELHFALLEANRKVRIRNPLGGFDHAPTPEGRNPPQTDDPIDAEYKKKIPDFYWGYIDHLEPDSMRCARNFIIECKRLGKPLKKDKVLTQLYIQNGVRRFITETHSYARGEPSAAMVGYVQNMEFYTILQEVNAAANANLEPISPLQLSSNGWQENSVSELIHDLERPFPTSPFRLYHFWIDIRSTK